MVTLRFGYGSAARAGVNPNNALSAMDASVAKQADFTTTWLAEELSRSLNNPTPLIAAAANAKDQGRADAADRLADLVMATAGLA
ncbi:MAG: hypothetical protein WCP99_14160 [Burkholderiales bacterium]